MIRGYPVYSGFMTCIIAISLRTKQFRGMITDQLLNKQRRTVILWYAFVFLILSSTSEMFAQPAAWTHYSISNSPLPDQNVHSIVFENDSTTWIGTGYGLARFDGTNWTIYNNLNSGLIGNDIRSLAIDKSGNIWVGTFNNGLNLFDGTNWTNFNTLNSPLPDDFVRSLAIDTNNTKWIGTIGGLARLDTTGTWTIYTMWNSGLGSNNIAELFVDTTSNVKWAGTVNGGLLEIEDDTIFTKYTIQNSGISDNSILDIDRDPAGNLFLASPANGLIIKLAGFGWFTFNPLSSSIPTAGLTSLVLDGNGDVWMGTFDKGVVRKTGNTFRVFNTTNSPLNDSAIQTVVISPTGKVFIGTQTGGMFVLDPTLLTGLEEQNPEKNKLSIHPNPTTGNFRWQYDRMPYALEVVSADGRKVTYLSLIHI